VRGLSHPRDRSAPRDRYDRNARLLEDTSIRDDNCVPQVLPYCLTRCTTKVSRSSRRNNVRSLSATILPFFRWRNADATETDHPLVVGSAITLSPFILPANFAPARTSFSRISPTVSGFSFLGHSRIDLSRDAGLAQVCAADSHPPIGMHGQAKGARNQPCSHRRLSRLENRANIRLAELQSCIGGLVILEYPVLYPQIRSPANIRRITSRSRA